MRTDRPLVIQSHTPHQPEHDAEQQDGLPEHQRGAEPEHDPDPEERARGEAARPTDEPAAEPPEPAAQRGQDPSVPGQGQRVRVVGHLAIVTN